MHTIKWWYSLKQGDSLAKTKFVSSVPSIMSNIFGCSARMVANRSRVWKVTTSLMMNFDLQGILKRRQKIGKIQHDHYETFLIYLVILLLTNANDIHLNPGPRTEREYDIWLNTVDNI
jgi:hypothetical protein